MPGVLDTLLDELEARQNAKSKKQAWGSAAAQAGNKALGDPYYTGPGGLFGVDGLERDIISTRVQPIGIAGRLMASPSERMNPLFGYLTGFQDVTGTNADGVCDDPQTAGPGKSCIQTAQFGRYSYQTRELELNRLGQQTDRGEFMDLRLLNDPLLAQMSEMVQPNVPGNMMLGREVLMRFLEIGVAYQNKLARQVYVGNPANNSAGGGYAEYPGLDILIGTNKFDALTGVACPSLASDIKNFNYENVDDTPDNIVNVITYLYRYLQINAETMGFNPVKWVITMRRALFWELTAVWPCSYLTYRCKFLATDGSMITNVSATDQVAMRDAMRNGNYLLINGEEVEVILDDGIVEETNTDTGSVASGSFASDIYFIPLTVRGGVVVTHWEYFDYSRGPMQGVMDGRLGSWFWSDGGRFLWSAKPPENWCVTWLSKIEPRLILRTPQLAGKLLNVQYSPLQHEREPFPGDPYFVNGGVSTARPGPSLWSDWNAPG